MFGVYVLNRSFPNTKFTKGEPFKKIGEETFCGRKSHTLQHTRQNYKITVKDSELQEEFDLLQ
jgi:hypothetical protein